MVICVKLFKKKIAALHGVEPGFSGELVERAESVRFALLLFIDY